MDERLQQFRFLSDEEFSVLPRAQKALYLSVATQALEQVQRKLKGQMRQFVSEPKSPCDQPNTATARCYAPLRG